MSSIAIHPRPADVLTQKAPQSRAADRGRLLIYAPVPVWQEHGQLMVEAQAANGLRLWAENFERVVAIMPMATSRPAGAMVALDASEPAISVEPVPFAYRPDVFLRQLSPVRRRMREFIAQADYLSFALGGLIGDWGAVAALEAHRMGRRFAVWTDRVESEVVRRSAEEGRFRSRLRARLTHRPMAWLERYVIERSTLGLFHGRDTFEAYSGFCSNPQIVHDIHLKRSDHISAAQLHQKLQRCRQGPLRIVYAGRADAMKAPLDWVETLELLARENVDFRAVWLGDGELHADLVSRIELAGLGTRVTAPGYVSDREVVLRAMRDAHVFLFCHRTPESPRCLIEALVSGCPIIGYESGYARDLIASAGGGAIVPSGEVAMLAKSLAVLDRDREMLQRMIVSATQDGKPFDEELVFRHRSELIKEHLAP